MSIISAIKSADYAKYMARGVGALTLYLVARDAHNFAKIQSDTEVETYNGKAAEYYFNNTLTLDKPSTTKNNLQKAVFKYELDDNLRGFINSIIGYVKGGVTSLVADVIPLGLGIFATFSKFKPLAKLSALGLCVTGAVSVFKDGFGFGKNLKEPSK